MIKVASLAAVVVVVVFSVLGAAGVPTWLAVVLGVVFGALPIGCYIAGRVVKEAMRQGWGK